ncbi:putative membrane protein [Pseudoglutamicibacter albus]|uniref:Membrane protein n=1 Tax=Pseudoglutamicibacter albus TaxID=98671 RepID=A0ABU1YWZ3_9MICC|nr:putative membrane protein [Pseudoglutamicibacter albus]
MRGAFKCTIAYRKAVHSLLLAVFFTWPFKARVGEGLAFPHAGC